jgi:WD40 repeat protein
MPQTLATGDDDGVIKLWDPRKPTEIRAYKQHFDFISDFLWLDDKKILVATSGDGTLSVMDVRANKTEPAAQSEDQEDELLSIVAIKNNTKVAIGTQTGIISIFNRSAGWGDCVDRMPGHPSSIDALCTLPPSISPSTDVVATGSSDGMIRLVQLLPHKFLGVVGDHGEFPVERIKMEFGGDTDGREPRWLGSVSHDEALKLTDLKDALEDSDDDERPDEKDENGDEDDVVLGSVPSSATKQVTPSTSTTTDPKIGQVRKSVDIDVQDDTANAPGSDSDANADSDSEPEQKKKKRKRRKKNKSGSNKGNGKGGPSSSGASAFFAGL